MAHLNLSADPYLPIWEREIAQGAEQKVSGEHAYRLDFWGRVLLWALEPPPKFRFPAPREFQPLNIGTPDTILPAFLDRQSRILRAIQSAHGIAIDRIKITSPFDRRVRYCIWSSFCVTASHARRHLWQAETAAQILAG